LLEAANNGSLTARDQLMAVVYDDLRRLAGSYMKRERPDHTLQPTALVNEAYLRLVGQKNVNWQNREHLIAVAAMMMRRILLNHAYSRKRDKRGGGKVKVSLAEADCFVQNQQIDVIALDEALKKLGASYTQESQIVELRFFGGLTIQETARVLRISESTVERDWKFARAWLLCELNGPQVSNDNGRPA
jgi:RNA polymerase sigma factor (TIGR02999 family)